jgi:RimJ/RimL family protein N-acetyltransferase
MLYNQSMSNQNQLKLANAKESYKNECYEIYLENDNYLSFAHVEPRSQEKFNEKFELPEIDPCFVLVNDKDKVIGFCSVLIARLDAWADINYMVRAKYQNQGYGKEMLTKVIEQIKTLSNVDYLEAETYNNPKSDKLLTSSGFIKASFYPDYHKIFQNGEYTKLDKTGYYLKLK